MFGALGGGASLGTLASAAIGSANYEDILLDACAHLFGVIGRIFDSAIGKNNGELLAAATISHAAMDMAQMGGDFTQDVVAGLMAEVVIELLKKIHIDYGDAIAAAKGGEGLVKGAAGGKAGDPEFGHDGLDQLLVESLSVRVVEFGADASSSVGAS